MKKILIFSDTHGNIDECINAVNNTDKVSAIIHAGDCTRDAEDLKYIYPGIPVYYVCGNNDIFSNAPSSLNVTVGGLKIYITHGHEQRVKYESSYTTLRNTAMQHNPDLVVFGHTHIPYTSYDGGFILLNPGSVLFSKTYAVAEIENGKINTKIIKIL